MFIDKIKSGLFGLGFLMCTSIVNAEIYTFTQPEIRIHNIATGVETSQASATTNFPHQAYASPSDSKLFVVDSFYARGSTVVQMSVVDTHQGTEIRRADIGSFPNLNPNLAVKNTDGSKWYFGNHAIWSDSGYTYTPITVFDTNTMSVVTQIPVDFYVSEMKVSPDGSRLYTHARTSGFGDSILRVFDTESGQLVNEASFLRKYASLKEIHPSGNYLYMTYERRRARTDLYLLDVNTLELLPEPLLLNVRGEVLAKGNVLINNTSNVIRIYNIEDHSLRGEIPYSLLGMNTSSSFVYEASINKIALIGSIPTPDYRATLQVLSIIDAGTATVDYVKTSEENYDLMARLVEIVVDSEKLSISLQKVNASVVKCINNTTGQEVSITPQFGEVSWDCEDNGLLVSSGDTVTLSGTGAIP